MDQAPNNLPLELTGLVGRKREISEVEGLLAEHRLLTLTGPGGSGKTRLALAVASALVDEYEDGVWLVELASLSDPDLVPQAVASALGVREEAGTTLLDSLRAHLKARETLLVLDNCEHLVGACADLAEALLRSCPELRILVTSREALGVAGEALFVVPPLSLPDPRHLQGVGGLTRYEAARLFVERARAARPDFEITERNAMAVAQVCYRLDGMPLAIELAAARVRVLSVEQIASRLDDRFALLTGGRRTASAHQVTLRATMDWSFELLQEEERVLLRRLSVFAGGFTLKATEEVCSGEGLERGGVLDLLSSLVDKSLVLVAEQQSSEARYQLLETVRQYGREKLDEVGEVPTIRRRHAGFFVGFVEEAEPELKGALQETWLKRLEKEHDNLRAALSWSLASGEGELGLRLGGALGEFWHMRGNLSEGQRWLQAALANATEETEPVRVKVLARAGWIAREQGDYERSVALTEESLALARRLGDKASAATALYTLGWAALFQNELERASELTEEAVRLQREMNDRVAVALALTLLGFVANVQHHYQRAMALHEESLVLAREAEDGYAIVLSLGVGATASLGLGDHRRTMLLCAEGLELSQRLGTMRLIAGNLNTVASVAGSQGRPIRAARLWGAAESLLEAIGSMLTAMERHFYEPYIAAARARLDEAAWEAAWEEGKAMTPEEAVEYALEPPMAAPDTEAPPSYPAGLSAREVEVLRLLAGGMTNPQIAQELFISPRTVDAHLRSVYHKTGSSTRAEATRFALEHDLLLLLP